MSDAPTEWGEGPIDELCAPGHLATLGGCARQSPLLLIVGCVGAWVIVAAYGLAALRRQGLSTFTCLREECATPAHAVYASVARKAEHTADLLISEGSSKIALPSCF